MAKAIGGQQGPDDDDVAEAKAADDAMETAAFAATVQAGAYTRSHFRST
jgi:hypothetical protein